MIDLLPSSEQLQIVDAARDLLTGRLPVDRLRTRETGDPAFARLWSELVEFGWFSLALPEEDGGAGAGIAEEMLLFVEAGRHLLPPSVPATSLAAHVAAAAGRQDVVDRLTTGASRAGFAVPDLQGGWLLLDAGSADRLLVLDGAAARLHAVDGITGRHELPSLDEAVRLEHAMLPAGAEIEIASEAIGRRALVLLGAMLVGGAEASRDLAVDYAKIREQFGQPIGAFQAVKHRCTDMAVEAEMASAQVAFATLAVAYDEPDAEFQATGAAIAAIQAARRNGAASIQIHGGMGFTFECHAHRFVKRSHVLEEMLGGLPALEARLLAATPAFG